MFINPLFNVPKYSNSIEYIKARIYKCFVSLQCSTYSNIKNKDIFAKGVLLFVVRLKFIELPDFAGGDVFQHVFESHIVFNLVEFV